jgi:cytochrome c1
MMMRTGLLWLLSALAALAADQGMIDKGQKEEQRVCLPCHSLRLIHSNRLSRAAWNKELDKMAGWGVKYTDRDAILEYLVATYGDDKPVTPPDMSGDGRTKQ